MIKKLFWSLFCLAISSQLYSMDNVGYKSTKTILSFAEFQKQKRSDKFNLITQMNNCIKDPDRGYWMLKNDNIIEAYKGYILTESKPSFLQWLYAVLPGNSNIYERKNLRFYSNNKDEKPSAELWIDQFDKGRLIIYHEGEKIAISLIANNVWKEFEVDLDIVFKDTHQKDIPIDIEDLYVFLLNRLTKKSILNVKDRYWSSDLSL